MSTRRGNQVRRPRTSRARPLDARRLALILFVALSSGGFLSVPIEASPGTPDSAFGRGGVARARFTFSTPSIVLPGPMVRQRDGKLVVVGNQELDGGERGSGVTLARFTRSGHLDRGFGRNGRVTQ